MLLKVRILNKSGEEKFILLNQNNIVSVEEVAPDYYNIHLSDGRIVVMTEEMYKEHFVNDEEEDEAQNVIMYYGEQA